jgi:hypothetical protein
VQHALADTSKSHRSNMEGVEHIGCNVPADCIDWDIWVCTILMVHWDIGDVEQSVKESSNVFDFMELLMPMWS